MCNSSLIYHCPQDGGTPFVHHVKSPLGWRFVCGTSRSTVTIGCHNPVPERILVLQVSLDNTYSSRLCKLPLSACITATYRAGVVSSTPYISMHAYVHHAKLNPVAWFQGACMLT